MRPVLPSTRASCPYCGSDAKPYCVAQDLRKKLIAGDFVFLKCPRCHAVFQDPMPAAEKIPSFYQGEYNPYDVYDQQFVWGLQGISDRGSVLDVGCGAGNTLASFLKQYPFWNVTGYDFSEDALTKARARMPQGNFRTGDLLGLLGQTPDDQFDIVLCEHVVEHVLQPSILFSELARVLKPGGLLLLAYPNSDSLTQRLFKKYYFNLEAPRHLALPSPASFEYLSQSLPITMVKIFGQTYPTTLLGSIELWSGRAGISRRLQKWRVASVISYLLKPLARIRRAMFLFSKINVVYRKDLNNVR